MKEAIPLLPSFLSRCLLLAASFSPETGGVCDPSQHGGNNLRGRHSDQESKHRDFYLAEHYGTGLQRLLCLGILAQAFGAWFQTYSCSIYVAVISICHRYTVPPFAII